MTTIATLIPVGNAAISDKRGQDMIEYALVAALVVVRWRAG